MSTQPPTSSPSEPLSQPTFSPPPPPYPFSPDHCAIITQGAEAHLYKTHFLTPSTPAVLKVRPSKPYRHPILDRRLTRQRVLAEARVLVKLGGLRGTEGGRNVGVPALYGVEWDLGRKVKGLPQEMRRGGQVINAQQGQGSGGSEGGTNSDSGSAAAVDPSLPSTSTATAVSQSTSTTTAAAPALAPAQSSAWILLEYIPGPTLNALLRQYETYYKQPTLSAAEKQSGEDEVRALLRRVGFAVGALHLAGVVHGDLTSSNIIVRQDPDTEAGSGIEAATGAHNTPLPPTSTTAEAEPDTPSIIPPKPNLSGPPTLLDFGLASQSSSASEEDRAVDLYVLERAFGSTHPGLEAFFDGEVLRSGEGYRAAFGEDDRAGKGGREKECERVLKRLEEVRLRGRKRSMVG